MKKMTQKVFLLLSIVLFILFTFPVSALADDGEGGSEFTQTVNGYRVVLVFEKAANLGQNQIQVRVTDSQNMPVTNAHVALSMVNSESEHAPEPPSMSDDMPGMDMSGASAEVPSSEHDAMGMTTLKAGQQVGEYTGEITIETAGKYILRVHLTVGGKLTEVDFPLTIAQTQAGLGIMLGFLAVNVTIITMAVVLKPKPVLVKA